MGSTQTLNDVTVANGYFTVALDFGAAAFKGDARWIVAEVRPGASTGSYTTLSPRTQLASVPYALGLRLGTVINTSQPNVPALTVSAPNANSNTLVATGNAAGYAVIFGEDQSPADGYGLYGKSGSGTGVRGESTSWAGVWGESTNASGVVGISAGQFNGGVYGQTNGSGYGVYGQTTNGAGVYGQSTNWLGVVGQSTNHAGVVGESSGHDGVRGITTTANRIGVKGVANATGSVGVWGESAANTGVYAQSGAANGVALWGRNTAGGIALRAEGSAVQSQDMGGLPKVSVEIDSSWRLTNPLTGGRYMTALRQRMTKDLQLRGLAPRAQEAYLRAVVQLMQYCQKSPEVISEDDLRQYFPYLRNEKRVSRNTMILALCGVKFCFEHTLGRQWTVFDTDFR